MRCVPFDMDRNYIPLYAETFKTINYKIRSIHVWARSHFSETKKHLDMFQKSGIIFVHIPKNAGSSIVRALYGEPILHNSAQYYRAVNGKTWSELPSCAILRDPTERFISAYNYLRYDSRRTHDREFGDTILARYEDAQDCANAMVADPAIRQEIMRWSHFRPQSEFICDRNGKVMVSFLGSMQYMEHFVHALNQVSGKTIALTIANVGTRSKSKNIDISSLIKLAYQNDQLLFDMVGRQEDKIIQYAA